MNHHLTNRAALAVTMTLAFGVAPAMAQLAMPAEQPPAGFEATEYVDSSGCVFVRVDVGDRVEWVPRVGPDRQQLCGMEPPSVPVMRPRSRWRRSRLSKPRCPQHRLPRL
jgi:hypothetical protein